MAAKLRLMQFCECGGGRQRVGVELGSGGKVVDVTRVDPSIPTDMKSFLEQWETSTTSAAKYVCACMCVCVCACVCVCVQACVYSVVNEYLEFFLLRNAIVTGLSYNKQQVVQVRL